MNRKQQSDIIAQIIMTETLDHYIHPFNNCPANEFLHDFKFNLQKVIPFITNKKKSKPTRRFNILGGMNDPPDSPYLEHFAADAELNLNNALANAQETKPPTVPSNIPAPPHTNWTHRHKQ